MQHDAFLMVHNGQVGLSRAEHMNVVKGGCLLHGARYCQGRFSGPCIIMAILCRGNQTNRGPIGLGAKCNIHSHYFSSDLRPC